MKPAKLIGVIMATGAMMSLAACWAVTPAVAQSTPSCSEYRGLVCEGLFTDEPDLVADPTRVADAIARVSQANGTPFAVVIASNSRGRAPADFAVELADAWGVGDPGELDGILVLISIDEQRTEVVTQPGIDLPGTAIANAGRSFFAAGDFEGGVLAIVGAVDQAISGETSSGGTTNPPEAPEPRRGGIPIAVAVAGVLMAAAIGVGAIMARRHTRRTITSRARSRRIDAAVAGLEPRGDEIELVRTFSVEPGEYEATTTASGVQALFDLSRGEGGGPDADTVRALAAVGAVRVIDVDRLVAETRVPLDLRASGERPVLEAGLEGAIDTAAEVSLDDDQAFEVAMTDLHNVIDSLRPHRVAAARRRAADSLLDRLTRTAGGFVYLDHLASLVMRAAPVLDTASDLADAVADVMAAHDAADRKVDRMASIRARMSATTTRDVTAVALADLFDDADTSLAAYGAALDELQQHGDPLVGDGVSLPAVAALLVLNNSATDIPAFVDAYRRLRSGATPPVALEAAVAGLFTLDELATARMTARDLGIPLAVTVALGRRRDDGPTVYRRILTEIAPTAEGEDASVIAGILAVSLEPSVAVDRWMETRTALSALGLSGAYADVAAAFGASDPRGPRAFALAYAAQRSALEDRGYGSLTRYAPELAHAGTSHRRDTWTGRPLGTTITDFDPFTLFYLHWAATGGHHGGGGWQSLYTSGSWKDGGSGWWGGGGGFGSSGGASWGSASGGVLGGIGTGGFGGFGGGGGFSSSGGGGW
jgi:uncharacterized membrane protein YgcG